MELFLNDKEDKEEIIGLSLGRPGLAQDLFDKKQKNIL